MKRPQEIPRGPLAALHVLAAYLSLHHFPSAIVVAVMIGLGLAVGLGQQTEAASPLLECGGYKVLLNPDGPVKKVITPPGKTSTKTELFKVSAAHERQRVEELRGKLMEPNVSRFQLEEYHGRALTLRTEAKAIEAGCREVYEFIKESTR